MDELIQKLQSVHGLSAGEANSILNTITTFIKEKFPMVSGAIDNLFKTGATASLPVTTDAHESVNGPVHDGGDFLDEISDFIPGETGEKTEGFTKKNLGGLFGEDKTV